MCCPTSLHALPFTTSATTTETVLSQAWIRKSAIRLTSHSRAEPWAASAAQADAAPRADSFLRRSSHAIASFNIRSILPGTNTRLFGNYEYVADGAVVPRHIFSTQRLYTEPGLNLIVRQPLPSFWGIGRLELSADLRNLLAQGYMPVASGQGRQLLVVQAPRAVRGGLNFIF